jgi:hypothetical protein
VDIANGGARLAGHGDGMQPRQFIYRCVQLNSLTRSQQHSDSHTCSVKLISAPTNCTSVFGPKTLMCVWCSELIA